MANLVSRLGPIDLIDLAIEDDDMPINVGAVLRLDGGPLTDQGAVKLDEVRTALAAHIEGLPRLRQVIYRPGLFGGRPLWTDDPSFRIERHVREIALPPPADERALWQLAAELLSRRLDRTRPMWRLWIVPGLPDGQVALIMSLHHVLADGTSAMRLLASLLDGPGTDMPGPTAPRPHWAALVTDNLRQRAAAVAQWRLHHLLDTIRHLRPPTGAGARTSLNAPIGRVRALAVLRLPLADVHRAAHAQEATINDAILTLIAGGLRALLAGRGEDVTHTVLNTAVAVSLRPADRPAEPGNVTGSIMVRLALGEADPQRRLHQIHRETAMAKRTQVPTMANLLLLWFARLGVIRWASRHQRITNVVESDVIGPREPLHLLGATVTDVVAVGNLAGNIGISFVALSYVDELAITVHVDAAHFPDLTVVMTAMRDEWGQLATQNATAVRR